MQNGGFNLVDAVAVLGRTPASLKAILTGLPEAGKAEPFEPFDRTAQFDASRGQTLDELLATFAAIRRENLAALGEMNLTSADLSRTGHHPALGAVTLAQLLATWVVHDLDHVGQIARTMAKVYADAVGPWSAYLSFLHDRK
ncbi:MAG TPA: DinB family protein [Symbiobacteriaceae bacterium]|nr:DinB family protein [Symbiobacteriaceae bacterium]